ncbi:hypothetical protein C7212DRAFT_342942 [Tuber magnatum]|uniref:Uncharacterized protein n=1 Tax=Tuber magnatum TaxID=42249 RepID=A0A317SRL8_9PEZI|nr:hypothetical protein C7212DRAFT_342942 [Tuber magnatum]
MPHRPRGRSRGGLTIFWISRDSSPKDFRPLMPVIWVDNSPPAIEPDDQYPEGEGYDEAEMQRWVLYGDEDDDEYGDEFAGGYGDGAGMMMFGEVRLVEVPWMEEGEEEGRISRVVGLVGIAIVIFFVGLYGFWEWRWWLFWVLMEEEI